MFFIKFIKVKIIWNYYPYGKRTVSESRNVNKKNIIEIKRVVLSHKNIATIIVAIFLIS